MLRSNKISLASFALAMSMTTAVFAQSTPLDLKFAGALEFSDTGTLFVGDNYNGAIYAFEMIGDCPSSKIYGQMAA